MAGNAFTLIAAVDALHPVVEFVNVKVVVPNPRPLTKPLLLTVATAVLLLIQVPPDKGNNWMLLPSQTADGPESIGTGSTVRVAVAAFMQPLTSDTV